MTYVITSGCCSDASCVAVCPVNCIHPTPDEPDFGSTATLFVDPATCIDCGACADACPVDAIGPLDRVKPVDAVFIGRNEAFYRDRAERQPVVPKFPATLPHAMPQPHVAVVGTGPAANYTADLLLRSVGAEVTMFDRLPVTGGLLRYGVAPDHPSTRQLGARFTGFLHNPELHLMLGVEIGTDVTTTELAEHFDAVVYATGASTSRDLGIPGERLPGSTSATEFVAWYNAHPDAAGTPHGLSAERAVIIGNGNVALDVARILLTPPEQLATTDIADHALAALRDGNLREVVISARRGPEFASYTLGELHALKHLPDVDLVVADRADIVEVIRAAAPGSAASWLSDVPVVDVDWSAPPPPRRRIVLQFEAVPVELTGRDEVEAIAFADGTKIPTGLVIRAIGYRGLPLADLPFDELTSTIPHRDGVILDRAGEPLPGHYVVGWAKRGATGGIGANRQDAAETVAALTDDLIAGRLPTPSGSAATLRSRLTRRLPAVVDRRGLLAIDAAEQASGRLSGRPRVKLSTRDALIAAARR